MWTEFPPSNPAREDMHEQSDIDEASVEMDVGYIANPDPIALSDVKGLQLVPPGLQTLTGMGRLTDTSDEDREVGNLFHQPGDASIPTGYP